MKKRILLPLVLGLGFLFLANPVKSQNFQIVASFGTAHNWNVPNSILYELDYYYPYHQIVHINREFRGRNLFYNVLLENRGQFVELFFGRQAMILDINYFYNYPLAQHICNSHCGYHGNFFRAHQVACNHRNHSFRGHSGHNHIAYRSGRNYNSYAARNSAANRNVGIRSSSSNPRSDSRRSSVNRNTINRSTVRDNSVVRGSNSGRVRSNSSPRISSSSRNANSSVRDNQDSRNNTSRNSRSAVSASSSRRN